MSLNTLLNWFPEGQIPPHPAQAREEEPVTLHLTIPTARSQNRVKKQNPARPTTSMVRNWKQARKWILQHLSELERAGWTRGELFRAGRLRYPHGEDWGVAWLSLWTRAGVTVGMAQGGEILFQWTEPGGRTVTQAARPKRPRGQA